MIENKNEAFTLVLMGKPIPRKDHSGTGHHTWDTQSNLKQRMRWELKSQYAGKPLHCMVRVDTIFYFPIPKSKLKRFNANPSYRWLYPKRPDRDNLDKLYNDCLQPYILADDCLIVDGSIRKMYGVEPRVEFTILPLEGIYEVL